MRKLLNELLIKFGLLITKAPTLLSDKSLQTSDAFPAELTGKVTVREATDTPTHPLFDMLHEPCIDRKETNFRHDRPEAVKELELSYLSANLASISFYDSIVVFDKKKRHLPSAELHIVDRALR